MTNLVILSKERKCQHSVIDLCKYTEEQGYTFEQLKDFGALVCQKELIFLTTNLRVHLKSSLLISDINQVIELIFPS